MSANTRTRYSDRICLDCPAQITVSDVSKGCRRCPKCRLGKPPGWLGRPAQIIQAHEERRTRPRSSAESVWMTAEREDFTARMTSHFAIYRQGLSHFSAPEERIPARPKRQPVEETL